MAIMITQHCLVVWQLMSVHKQYGYHQLGHELLSLNSELREHNDYTVGTNNTTLASFLGLPHFYLYLQ